MTVFIGTSLEPSVRGTLKKWMLEISPCVFVGCLSSRIRRELLNWLAPQIKTGELVMIYSDKRTQTGYKIDVVSKSKTFEVVEMSGIPLIKKLQRKRNSPANTS